jgi:uroporphyrinogen decarboxylase
MTDVAWVNKILPKNMPVQGNLDPLSLLVGGSEMTKSIDHILDSFKDRPHIFNLGHGITPPTPICNVEQMVQWVRKS